MLFGKCPFHNDKYGTLIVSEWYNTAHCVHCNQSYSPLQFVAQKEWLTLYEAYAKLVPPPENEDWKKPYIDFHKIVAIFRKQYDGSPAQKYMQSRWVPDYIAEQFNIWYSDSGIFKWRVVFPIKNMYGQYVGATARTLTNETPKYVNSQSSMIFQKKRVLYWFDPKNIYDYYLLVEWQMDVIKLQSIWYVNAVCSSWTAINRDQLIKLTKIVICFDSDEAGMKATTRTKSICEELKIPYEVLQLDGKDPDEFISSGGTIPLSLPKILWEHQKHTETVAQYALVGQETIEWLSIANRLLPHVSDDCVRDILLQARINYDSKVENILNKELKMRTQNQWDNINIEELKSSVPIESVIEHYCWQLNTRFNIPCPLPEHEDWTPSFSINRSRNLFKCFGCNKWGTQIDFIMEMDKCDLKTAITKLQTFL